MVGSIVSIPTPILFQCSCVFRSYTYLVTKSLFFIYRLKQHVRDYWWNPNRIWSLYCRWLRQHYLMRMIYQARAITVTLNSLLYHSSTTSVWLGQLQQYTLSVVMLYTCYIQLHTKLPLLHQILNTPCLQYATTKTLIATLVYNHLCLDWTQVVTHCYDIWIVTNIYKVSYSGWTNEVNWLDADTFFIA